MVEKEMTDEEMAEAMADFKPEAELSICQQYLQDEPKFKWFIEKYYGFNQVVLMSEMAKDSKEVELLNEMSKLWYVLPDSIFNIINMPEGWREFTSILES